eukprot:gnl/TRDRNA2_/TRDRNA2_151132_c0_seq1.p1 gnl/TRDRNA2_/TRDRNA2_151132_c0~~gnl/TRDRNA2_/TRDRNA2_151132_c0_seq1.p1  ORF type:complete len:575 (-),score=135.37 gnl/TRDRNA2_/TRDRNA2_151132_c0_seq1:39-1700(-)
MRRKGSASPIRRRDTDTEAHYDRLKDFLLELNINVPNAVDLVRCTLKQQEELMASFSPKEGRNVNDEFGEIVKEFLEFGGRFVDEEEEGIQFGNAVADADEDGREEKHQDEGADEQEQGHQEPEIEVEEEDAEGENDGFENSAEVDEFCQKWGLNEDAMVWLSLLPPELQEEVMHAFDPGEVADVSSKFIAYVKMKNRRADERRDADQNMSKEMKEFAEKWGLHERAMDRLREQPVDVQEDVMKSFAPGDDTRDMTARFLGFLKTRRSKGGRSWKSTAKWREDRMWPELPSDWKQRGPEEIIELFVQTWGLNDDAAHLVRNLRPDLREEVIETFAPKSETKDVNSKLFAFVKMKQNRPSSRRDNHAAALEQFQKKWNLDDAACRRLRELPAEDQEMAMRDFNPPIGTRDVSAKFTAFVKNMRNWSGGGGGKEKDSWSWDRSGGWQDGKDKRDWQDGKDWREPARDKRDWRGKEWRDSRDPIQKFAKDWDLSEEAVNVLYSLSPGLRDEVIGSYNPGGSVRDPSTKLIAYIRSKQRSGRGDGDSEPPWKRARRE